MPRFGGARTRLGVSLYLCFVDESGSHGASPVFVAGGLIVHDQSSVEGRLRNWTNQWRTASSSLGQLRNLADVPLFADSRATRTLQATDLVAYALFRYYSKPGGRPNERYARRLWPQFDSDRGRMHGLIHDSDYFGSCQCPACASRR